MKKNELKKILELKKIPSHYYNIDEVGEIDQRICLEYRDFKWNVYFSERGKKIDLGIFDSEEEACQDLYNRVIKW